MGLKSKVSVAKTGTSSLRTTIPEGIVEYLKLKPGDVIEWNMETNEETERVTMVKKVNK